MTITTNYNDVIEAALVDKADDEAVRTAIRSMHTAKASGEDWPDHIIDTSVWQYGRNSIKALAKRLSTADVNYNDRVVNKPTVIGKRVQSADGRSGYQQELISTCTWAELRVWLAEILAQIAGLKPNVTMAALLLELEELVPESRGPRDACESLGMTVEQYLASKAAA